MTLPARFDSVEAVEDFMTTPSDALVADLARTPGDIMVLGVGGKMGPTLARLAKRAAPGKRVIGVARFSEPGVREALVKAGVEPIAADLLDRAQLEKLPKAANVVFMAGRKFGATGDVPLTWAMNVQVPAMVAEVFKDFAHRRLLDGLRLSVRAGGERRRERGHAAGAAARRLRHLLRRPRAHVRVFLRQARHAGPSVPPELRDRHALRRAARHRPQGARRRDDRSVDGPRQRDLAGRRQRGRAALPGACHDADHADQRHRARDHRGPLAGRRVRQASGQDAQAHRHAGGDRLAQQFATHGEGVRPASRAACHDDRMDGRLARPRHGHASTSPRTTRCAMASTEAASRRSTFGRSMPRTAMRSGLCPSRRAGTRTSPTGASCWARAAASAASGRTANGRRARWSCRSARSSPGSAWCWSPGNGGGAASARAC